MKSLLRRGIFEAGYKVLSRICREQDRIPDTKNPGTRWIREIESWNHILKNVNLQNASKEDSDLGTTLVPRDRGLRSHTQECPFKTQLQQRGLRIAYPFPRIVTQETNTTCNHLLKNALSKFATEKD